VKLDLIKLSVIASVVAGTLAIAPVMGFGGSAAWAGSETPTRPPLGGVVIPPPPRGGPHNPHPPITCR